MTSFAIARHCRAGMATTRTPSRSSCRTGDDESDGKTVMALAADGLAKPGLRDIGLSHLGMLGIGLERDQSPTGRQGAGEPDRAVAAERADLENAARTLRPRHQMKQLPLAWRNRNRRQSGFAAR